MEKKDEKENTILHFIYISDQDVQLNKIFELVKLQNANSNQNFNDSNEIIINIELDDNNVYYYEVIDLYYNKNSK